MVRTPVGGGGSLSAIVGTGGLSPWWGRELSLFLLWGQGGSLLIYSGPLSPQAVYLSVAMTEGRGVIPDANHQGFLKKSYFGADEGLGFGIDSAEA